MVQIAHAIAPPVRLEIERRLAAVEADHGVRLMMAVESGSRAWGFPSPDSDFDVRFIYVHPRDRYLSLAPVRDVIEQPIEDDIDLSGWDIRKALMLLLKSNAVISEWIESPIRYRSDEPIVRALVALADEVLEPQALAHHYRNLGLRAADRWLGGEDAVPVKKYFYSLRPALAIRSLKLRPGQRPPMNLQALVAAAELSPEMEGEIADLVLRKKQTNELTNCVRSARIDAFIRGELLPEPAFPASRAAKSCAERANAIFLQLVNA